MCSLSAPDGGSPGVRLVCSTFVIPILVAFMVSFFLGGGFLLSGSYSGSAMLEPVMVVSRLVKLRLLVSNQGGGGDELTFELNTRTNLMLRVK